MALLGTERQMRTARPSPVDDSEILVPDPLSSLTEVGAISKKVGTSAQASEL